MSPSDNPLHVSRSAERAMHLLDAVISRGRLPLGEAARVADVPTSTALRHLRALEQNGFVARDGDGMFSAGPTFVRLALVALADGPTASLISLARPHLERLVAVTEESAYLAVRDGTAAVYVATVAGTRAVRHVGWVGRNVPLDGTAVGAALVAPRSADTPPPTHVNTGAAEPDVTAIAAAVHGPNGTPTAALSVIGPAHRLGGSERADAEAAVRAAAARLSEELGGLAP